MRKILVVAMVSMAMLCLSSVAFAQTQFGTVSGRVTDPNGAAVAGARVTLTNTSTRAKVESMTNDEGLYTVANVPAGGYEITVEKQGFKTTKQRATVEVAQRLDANITLEIGEITDVVNITEEVIPINTTSGELSRTISGQEIINLPLLTRNPYALVGLAAGASDTGQVTGDIRGVGFAVAGQRTSSVNFMLDGGENNDTFVAGVGQVIPLDAIQEFKVQSNNMTAEFGRNAVVANVVTKSGSNDLHGSAYEFYRGARLSTSTFDDNANGFGKSNFVRNNFGATVGGRIIKDKTFFFGSFEGLRVRSAASQRFFVPTQDFLSNASTNTSSFINAFGGLPAANDSLFLTAQDIVESVEGGGPGSYATTPLLNAQTGAIIPAGTRLFQRTSIKVASDAGAGDPQNTWLFTGKIDHHFSDRTSLMGRYAFQNTKLFDGTVSSSPYAGFNTGERKRNQNLNLTLTHSFSPTLFSESRVIYNRIFDNQPLGIAPGTAPCFNYGLNFNTPTGDIIAFPGYLPEDCSFAGIPFGGPQNIYQAFEGVTWSHGKHTIKAGGQYLHLRDNRTFGAFENCFYDAETMQGMLDGFLDVMIVAIDPKGKVPGDPYSPAVDGPYAPPSFTRHFRYNEWAMYLEDSFKWSPRLTFTAGLRYEYFGVLHSPKNERFLDANLYLNQVGTAGGGLFEQIRDARFRRTENFYKQDWNNFAPRFGFAWDIFGTGRTVLRGGYGIFYDRNFGNAVFNAIQNPPNYASITLFPDPGTAPILPNQFDTLNALGSSLVISSSARMLDNDLVTAYSAQWNATLEHDLFGKGIIAELAYVGSNGYKLYSLNNLNQRGSCLLDPSINPTCNPASSRFGRLNQTGLTGMNRRGNEALSRYKGFSVDIRTRRLGTSGLILNGNYTWSHSEDNLSSFFGDSPFEAPFGFGFRDPFNPAADRADSTNDIRHRGTISGTWELPFGKNSTGLARQILGGWTLNGIFVAQTGGAFTVYDQSDNVCSLSGTNFCAPFLAGSIPSRTNTPTPGVPNSFTLYDLTGVFQTQESFCDGDVTCMAQVANGLLGFDRLAGRNLFRTPGYWNTDVSVMKNFALPWREGMAIQLRGEFFNVFNHSNLYVRAGTNQVAGPTGLVTGQQVTAVRGIPPAFPDVPKERRNIQLAVRFIW